MAAKTVRQLHRIQSTTALKQGFDLQGKAVSYIDIYVEGTGGIRWVDHPSDHASLSTTVGVPLGDGKSMRYTGDYANFRLISVSGNVDVWCCYYLDTAVNNY